MNPAQTGIFTDIERALDITDMLQAVHESRGIRLFKASSLAVVQTFDLYRAKKLYEQREAD